MPTNFLSMQRCLIAHLRARVQNGQLTERGVARRTGISQPHIHNVLKGKRFFSWEAADAILSELNLTVVELAAGKGPEWVGMAERLSLLPSYSEESD